MIKLGVTPVTAKLGTTQVSKIYLGATEVWSNLHAYLSAVLADSPVAFWRHNESNGATMTDYMSALGGTYFNSPTFGATGPISDGATATTFNGTSQYGKVNYSALHSPTSAVTVEIWAYKASWTTILGGIGPNRTESGGYGLWAGLGTPNRVQFYVRRNGAYGIATAPSVLSAGWHHIVGTFDGRYAKLYIDGSLVSTDDAGANYAIQYASNNALMVAADPDGSSNPTNYFAGTLANSAIYSTALSSTRVQAHYDARNG